MSSHAPGLDWQTLTPELVLLLFALLAPIIALSNTDRRGIFQFAGIGLTGAFIMVLGTIFGWAGTLNFPWSDIQLGGLTIPGALSFSLDYIGTDINGVYAISEVSQFLKLLFLGVALLAVLGMGRVFRGKVEEDWGEFLSLILFATLGMMVVASATELITLFIGIEIASLSSYLLAGFHRDRIGAEAALKYFSFGAVSSGLTLFGISLLYGMTGTTKIAAIGSVLYTGGAFDAMTGIAIVLLLGGLGFKISSVPFHLWAPDVYSGAPAPVAGMLATASKAMGFAAIFNIFLVGLIGVKANWELAVAIVAVVTMFVGNLVALRQDSLRRMLAYSSIAQAGYLLIAVAVGTWYALGGGLLHLFVNAAMKLGAFLIVGILLAMGLSDRVDGYRGLGRRAPFIAFALTVFLLSMAGLPPLGGFTSKFVLFSSAIEAGVINEMGWLVWLAVFAVLNSAISLYYYLRVIRTMYVEEADEGAPSFPVSGTAMVAVGVCLLLVLVIGVYPQWFIERAMSAALSMLAPGA